MKSQLKKKWLVVLLLMSFAMLFAAANASNRRNYCWVDFAVRRFYHGLMRAISSSPSVVLEARRQQWGALVTE